MYIFIAARPRYVTFLAIGLPSDCESLGRSCYAGPVYTGNPIYIVKILRMRLTQTGIIQIFCRLEEELIVVS